MKTTSEFITFSPGLQTEDALANYWLQQVTVRLRREICWRWYLSSGTTAFVTLPPTCDRLIDALDLSRYWEQKCQFYENDSTAKYLTDRLATDPPPTLSVVPGSFSWVVETLTLDPVSTFILALGLIVTFDHAASEVIAACLNDPGTTAPTLALAQKLWHQPEAVLTIADLQHPLWRYGLLQPVQESRFVDWHSPLLVSPLVSQHLLFPDSPWPQVLVPLSPTQETALNNPRNRWVASRLCNPATQLRIVPVKTAKGAIAAETVQEIAQMTQRNVIELKAHLTELDNRAYIQSLVTLCWLKGWELLISQDGGELKEGNKNPDLLSLAALPITLFIEIRDRKELTHLPHPLLLPLVEVPQLSYGDRVQVWQQELARDSPTLNESIAECCRRFRYEKATIRTICAGLRSHDSEISPAEILTACRAELDLDIGELAQAVTPRFEVQELVLPPKQQALFEDIYQAMQSLTAVHYEWGLGKTWNECGISVLFAGLPGTGKTMAAEILATRLELPMYRIDLSQVVNKYIGETEKNLKRLFDAADLSDTLLFFDEADALFGRRTEVKDAHDRYANLEISYLLERMERFKGLAILATNRKKDLDEAFLRRLRYIVDFPLPDVRERQQIWQQAIPQTVDVSELDFEFMARQFPLAGGNIRSIVFNACLQTAVAHYPKPKGGETFGISEKKDNPLPLKSQIKNHKLTMEQLVICVKQEYDKLNRSVSLEQFGTYANLIERIDRGKK